MPDLDRARRWLNQHRLRHIEPTPLLAARLAACFVLGERCRDRMLVAQ